jgi:trimethylamine--corrinoid protein Co-methyltransferase
MQFPYIKVLSDDEVYAVHLHTMEVLETIGVACGEEQSLKVFEKGGARVDYEQNRAYIPTWLAKHALDLMPNSITFYDSFGKRVGLIGGDERHYGPLGYSTSYIDKDGTHKPGSYAALLEESELVDVIEEATFMHPSIQPMDKQPQHQDMYMVKAMLEGTRKPTHSVGNSERTAEAIIEMHAEVIGGADTLRDKPRHMFNVCTFSPLSIRKDACEVIRAAAKYKVPCMFSVGTMAGATAPVTLVGSVVQSTAELISHVVLSQLYAPGSPNSLLSASRIFDMKFGVCTTATPEYSLIKAAACQMSEYYGIPAGGMAPLADSNEYDAQYGWEKMATGLISRQSGMTLLWGMGMFSQLNMFGFEGLAIDAELVRTIERIARGMEVNNNSLAFEVIAESAKTRDFLGKKHTAKNYAKEFMMPVLTDRNMYSNYLKNQGNNMRQRARHQLDVYASKYSYEKGKSYSDKFQKIIDSVKI